MQIIKNIIRKVLRLVIPGRLLFFISYNPETPFGQLTYSQEGEDILLSIVFNDRKNGFYIDIGAHHPFRFSNTFYFYKRGWKGIAIDPLPGTEELFNRYRPNDIFIKKGLYSSDGEMNYFLFSEPALNTFSPEESKKRIAQGHELKAQQTIPVITLSKLLNEYMPSNQKITFMSMDAEGLDYEILKSNDWQKFRPEVIVFHNKSNDIQLFQNTEVFKYLNSLGYSFFGKGLYSMIFKLV